MSRQFLNLSRDNKLWKQLCFSHSYTERRRRRLEITLTWPPAETDPRLAELIEAANSLADSFDISVHNAGAPGAEAQLNRNKEKRRAALLSNWDPSGIGEEVDWYGEFVQRHAPQQVSWFQDAGHEDEDDDGGGDGVRGEATGAGILYDGDGLADKVVAPLDDGSIRIWDAGARSSSLGRWVATSAVGVLTNRAPQSRAMMTDTGAVECVSIERVRQRGFFAVQNSVCEVDLHTLQLVSQTPYPFAVTALSEAHHTTPLTVGTNRTLHLHDPRQPARPASPSTSTSTSFARLATGDSARHVALSQPGALSIAHTPSSLGDGNGDIWLAGRFTSLLNFDRRFFPRLRGTVHSGARLSTLSLLPTPFIPHTLRLGAPYAPPSLLHHARSTPGATLLAAGEYKGKASLELYSLSPDPAYAINSADSRTTRNTAACYQNRQTASASKLLSAAAHGTRLVFSDGDGNVKWVERDASTPVRQFNINDLDSNTRRAAPPSGHLEPNSHLHTGRGDIVQRIVPTSCPSVADTPRLGTENLLLWTGDGRLGMLSFGHEPLFAFDKDIFADALERQVDGEPDMRAVEREYSLEMRRALEMQARELRWLRGYGL